MQYDSSKITFAYPIPKPERETLGREPLINELLDVLYQPRMRNVVLVGDAGCGKTQLVREIALRTRDSYKFVELSVGGSVAGMKYVGDFEKRIRDFLGATLSDQRRDDIPRVVFVDEIHTIVGAGSTRGERRELDLANILKPYLTSGELIVWGATTPREYDDAIKPDAALRRRLPPIFVPPLPISALRGALRGMCSAHKLPESLADRVLELCDGVDNKKNGVGWGDNKKIPHNIGAGNSDFGAGKQPPLPSVPRRVTPYSDICGLRPTHTAEQLGADTNFNASDLNISPNNQSPHTNTSDYHHILNNSDSLAVRAFALLERVIGHIRRTGEVPDFLR